MLQIGDTLAGYRIDAMVGIGGMGVVYRATQLSLDRPVALKVLSSTLVGNRMFRERFRREGRHAALLDHPNIIPVYEAGESNGLMFIAMRLVDGPTLADLIGRGELSGRETLRILGLIASALDAAHAAHLVHRDVKPQNVLLTGAGHPYLADFGVTKGSREVDLTLSGDFVGSLSYVAPEQIQGENVTSASDVYALAAVLFHCLAGTQPYDRETDAALIHAHLSAPPPKITEIRNDLPAALDQVFLRGMAKEPASRFPSATALVEACREPLEALGTDALDSTPAFRERPDQSIDRPPSLTDAEAPVWIASPAQSTPGLTATDRRRTGDVGKSVVRQRRSLPRLRLPASAALVGVAVLALASPMIGWVMGREDSAPEPSAARSEAVEVTYDEPWTETATAIDGLELDDAIGLDDTRGTTLVAGRLTDPAPGFDPLPARLRERMADPKPTPVRLGSRIAVRYGGTPGSTTLWVALFPDTKGWTAVACESARGDPRRACVPVASTLRVNSATPVAVEPAEQTAETINSTIASLNRGRASARAKLRARSARVRASAARALSNTSAEAADVLGRLRLRPQEQPLFDALTKALRSQAKSLSSLADAALERRRRRYDRARAAVRTADRRILRAIDRLRVVGYERRRDERPGDG